MSRNIVTTTATKLPLTKWEKQLWNKKFDYNIGLYKKNYYVENWTLGDRNLKTQSEKTEPFLLLISKNRF
jgi:hypothetical protein